MTTVLLSGCLSLPEEGEKHPLIGRKVSYENPVLDDGSQSRPDIQHWYKDGTTLFITDNWLFPMLRQKSRARWWLAGDKYCRSFTAYDEGITEQSKAENIVCYRIKVSEDGKQIRFTSLEGGLFSRDWLGDYLN